MKRLIILLLALTISAAFDQTQGDYFQYKFSLLDKLYITNTDVVMILPEYLSVLTKYIAAITILWVSYLQETEYPKQMKIAALLMTGFGIDFLLECNHCWFSIGNYAFGYRSVAFLIFGIVIIGTIIKEKWTSL